MLGLPCILIATLTARARADPMPAMGVCDQMMKTNEKVTSLGQRLGHKIDGVDVRVMTTR
jgi:hypothetical protein